MPRWRAIFFNFPKNSKFVESGSNYVWTWPNLVKFFWKFVKFGPIQSEFRQILSDISSKFSQKYKKTALFCKIYQTISKKMVFFQKKILKNIKNQAFFGKFTQKFTKTRLFFGNFTQKYQKPGFFPQNLLKMSKKQAFFRKIY